MACPDCSTELLPEETGLIIADGYDAEILRMGPEDKLAAARRKVEIERLSRAALRRLTVAADPECAAWGTGDIA